MRQLGIAAALLVTAGPSPVAAQEWSPFFSERQFPERWPGSENREVPEDAYVNPGTFLAIHLGPALPVGTFDHRGASVAAGDVFTLGPGVAAEMAVPLHPLLLIGPSVIWYQGYEVDGGGVLAALHVHGFARAQIRRGSLRAWVDAGLGAAYDESDVVVDGITGVRKGFALAALAMIGGAVEVVRNWWIELGVRYLHRFVGAGNPHGVWGDEDAQWLLVTLGLGVQAT